MRKGVVVALLAAAWAPAAHACDVQSSPVAGAAPLTVTYTALCDAATYSWSFGDGGTAAGKTVSHTYAAGRWSGTLTTEQESTALPRAMAVGIELAAPKTADYRDAVVLSGRVAPGPARVRIYRGRTYVTTTHTDRQGRFRVQARLLGPGPYTAHALGVVSPGRTVVVRPVVETRLVGTPAVGKRLTLVARIRPARAGTLRVQVGKQVRKGRSLRIRLDTSAPRRLRVQVRAVTGTGYAPARRTLDVPVVFPDLAPGASGESVRELERQLDGLHYALAGVDGSYGQDTADAVMAFQKAEDLPRTGRADAGVWTALTGAATPKPRYGGDHVEVDKARQILLLVRDGETRLVVPVSTAGLPGTFTPLGRFGVYRKVPGWDTSPLGHLYDPMYFTGGYAIHGYPSVPPYPASHGCVRVPMWVAARLYATIPYGEPVYVY